MEHWVWDIDPTIVRFGPIQIRYYGLFFATVLLGGFYCWKQVMTRRGYPEEKIYSYFYWLTIMGIFGARVGHCLFYEPSRYLADPVQILYIWKGGLASHGGTIGLILGGILYSYLKRIPILVVLDGISWAAALAATMVRIGNFFNSEIVGRVSDVWWAVVFPRSMDGGRFARHPSQIYEATIGAVVFAILYLIDRKFKDRRPRGLMAGTFLVLYFPARFLVEYFKEYQTLRASSSVLTMGQYLSIPFFLFGLILLYFAWKDRGRLSGETPPDVYLKEETVKKQAKKSGKKSLGKSGNKRRK